MYTYFPMIIHYRVSLPCRINFETSNSQWDIICSENENQIAQASTFKTVSVRPETIKIALKCFLSYKDCSIDTIARELTLFKTFMPSLSKEDYSNRKEFAHEEKFFPSRLNSFF